MHLPIKMILPILLSLMFACPLAAQDNTAPPAPVGARARALDALRTRATGGSRLEELHKALKLTMAQEADWTEWSSKATASMAAERKGRPEMGEFRSQPAPERMKKLIAQTRARLSRLEASLAATEVLYAKLNPEQRKVFDELMPFGARGSHFHRREATDAKTPADIQP